MTGTCRPEEAVTAAVVTGAKDASAPANIGRSARRAPSTPESFYAPLPRLQRKCACGGGCPDCREETRVATASRTPAGGESLSAVRAVGGVDAHHITLHTDRPAAAVADAAGALAVTVGSDIYFGDGQFAPGTPAGDALIAHEATHARQYREGRVPMSGGVSTPSDPLEQEAFAAAARVTGLPVNAFHPGHARPAAAAGAGPMIMRWPRDAKGGFTLLALFQLASELTSRGVVLQQVGDVAALADLGDDAKIRTLLATLDVIRLEPFKKDTRLGDKARTIVDAWNANKDDIGFTNPRGTKYRTILHYVFELNRLAQASMAMDYLAAAKAMPDIRLSGVRIHSGGVGVHPRAVYFVAAGQIGIDEAAAKSVKAADAAVAQAGAGADPARKQAADTMRRAFGEGHYIPAGGFQWLFKDVVTMLTALGFSEPPRPRAGARSKGVGRATALDRSDLIYGVMRLEIDRMLLVMEGQETNVDVPSHEAAAHREPNFRAFLLARRKDIEAVAAPEDNDDVPRAAREMLTALGSPRGEFTHGGGTIDPHGTDHAMGLAFDFYNGSGALAGFRNFKVEQWPFIHRVISEHGGDENLPTNLRPSGIDALSTDTAQAIARLVQARGAEVAREILDEAAAADAEEKDPKIKTGRAATLKLFKRLRADVRDRMGSRRTAINRIGDKQMRHYPKGVNDALPALARDLRGFESVIDKFSATDIIEMLDGIDTRLQDLRKQAEAAAATVELEATAAATDAEKALAAREQTATAPEEAALVEVQTDRDDEKGLEEQIKDAGDQLAAATDTRTRRDLGRQLQRLTDLKASATRKWKEAQRRERAKIAKTAGQFSKERGAAASAARTAAAARNAAAIALSKVAPDPDPLGDLEFELHQIEGDADEAATIEIDRALRPGLKSGELKQWLKTVVDADHPFFDQPKAVVEGLNSVLAHAPIGGKQTTHFFSGHHWTIAPREILDSDTTYRASLNRDMGSRNLDNLRHVLSVMAESAGGRAMLFGPADKHDKTFDEALEARLKELNTTSQDLLDQVKAQVITPYESLSGESGRLLRELRARGHYLVTP